MPLRAQGFHDFILHDVLADVPHVTSRRMFGGWGIYKREKIFAIIVDEKFFLKGTGHAAAWFEKHGSSRFTYTTRKHPGSISMSYWHVAEEVLEDREAFSEWMGHASMAGDVDERVE